APPEVGSPQIIWWAEAGHRRIRSRRSPTAGESMVLTSTWPGRPIRLSSAMWPITWRLAAGRPRDLTSPSCSPAPAYSNCGATTSPRRRFRLGMSVRYAGSRMLVQPRFVPVAPDALLAQPLLADLALEYAQRYGSTPQTVLAWLRDYPAAEFVPPDGGMLIGV